VTPILTSWESASRILPLPFPAITIEEPSSMPLADDRMGVWRLVSEMDLLDAASEAAHALELRDVTDTYRSRQKLMYPDGSILEDLGRAHVDGYTKYTVRNVTPGRPLAIVRRLDYVYGDYELEIVVNGRSAGVSSCAGTDRAYRWRNWPFIVAGAFVRDTTLTIKQLAVTEGRDVNMYHYWFYQPE
jgi:hypothetical protein